MNHGEKAAQLFLDGYNCAQAIAVAFCDVTGMEEKAAAKMASSFGGGMGRLREVCGAVSGIFLVAGWLYGYDNPKDAQAKREHYSLVQELAAAFRERMGSIICRELLENPPTDPTPSPRTEEYYKTRPCVRMVFTAGEILESYIKNHPVAGEKL